MITCKELAELLLEFLDGDLPKERADVVSRHLSLCPPCVHFVESYKLTVQITRQLPCMELPRELVEKLKAALHDIEQKNH